MADLVKMSVDLFNKDFCKENLQIRLNTNYKIYHVKPSKKNGKPDQDFPSKKFYLN